MRASEVFDHPEWLGTEIVVDIYEPLRTSNQTSAARPGQVAVDLNDVGTSIFNLVPRAELAKLPPLRPPIRVRGVLRKDDERESRSGRTWRLLEVSEIGTLEYPTPVPAPSAADFVAEPERWHNRFVTVEGTWLVGFEASYLDKQTWVDFYPDAEVHCKPPKLAEYQPVKVRLTGFVYTKGGHYGHLGMAATQIVASELTYLDPRAPGCTP